MKRQNTPIAMANNALVTGPSVAEQNHAGVYFEHYNINANTVNAFSGKFESCLFEVGKGVSIEDKSNDEKSKEETTPKTTMHSYGINKDHTSSKEKQFVTDLPVFSNVIQDQDDSTNSSFPGIIGQSNSSALVQSDAFECDQSDSRTLNSFDNLSNTRQKNTKKIPAEHIHGADPREKKLRSERKRNDLPSFILTEIIRDNMSENDSLDSGFAGENCIDIIKSTPEVQVNKVRERKSYRNHGCFKKKHIEKILKIMKHANNTSFKKQPRKKVKTVSREMVFGNNQSTILVFGLGSYFDRLNTDPPPSFDEQMHYEWLRFLSFQNYSGSGSIIQLARHGFYHNPDDGPASTRCVYCDVCICNWSYFEDVASRHQQMSINCPVHHSTNPQGEFINDPIQRDNNNGSARIQTSQSVFTQIPLSSRLSMSVREVYRICGNQLNSMANPETVVAEVESTADAESQSVFSPNEVARRNFNQYYHDQPADVAPVPDAEDLGVSTRWNDRNEPLDQFGAVGGVDVMHPINEVHISNVIQDQHDAIVVDYGKKENNNKEDSTELTFRNINIDLTGSGEHEEGLDSDLSQESECEGAVGGDNPLSEHIRRSPSCEFLKSVYGEKKESSGPHDQNQATLQSNLPRKKVRSKVPNLKHTLFHQIDEDSESNERSGNTSEGRRSNDNNGNCHLLNSIQNERQNSSLTGGNLSDENELLRSSLLCHVCLDRSNIIRLPCGHLMTCSCCTNRSLQCLICNKCSGINSKKS